MTRDEMIKRHFKPYMEIDYINEQMKNRDGQLGVIIPCFLVSINFDEEIMVLRPIFNDVYTEEDRVVNISHCHIPKRKPKIAKFFKTIKNSK